MLVDLQNKNQFLKEQVGGKAHYLFAMKKAGLNVPNFVVVPVQTINELLLSIRIEIETVLINYNVAQLPLISKKIEALIFSTPNSSEVFKTILEQCKQNFGERFMIAVRSSAIDEDSDKASFAGQHQSFLFVDEKTLILKIKKSIASAWSLNALTYRVSHQISIQNIQYAIILQKMIRAQKSGVGFSMDVNANMAEMVIVSGYGLGEGIVSDLIETDTFFINRINTSVKQQISQKNEQLVYNEHRKQLEKTPIAKKLKNVSVLNHNEILKIVAVLFKAEKLLETIADIEFSFDENHDLFILQMRPVTGIDLSDLKILDNTNIVESYPDISLPLTFSFVNEAYAKVFKNASKAFWISKKTTRELTPIFNDLLAHYYGRIYYRLDNWYVMMSQLFPSKKAMESWEKAVGLKKDIADEKHISYAAKFKIYTAFLWLLIRYKKGNNYFFKQFKVNYSYLKSYYKKSSSKELLNHLDKASSKIYANWHVTLINDLISFKSFALLQKMIVKYNIGTEEMANDLLSGQLKSDSEKAILELLVLKNEIKKNKDLSILFQKSNTFILQELATNKYLDFNKKSIQYLKHFGDRTLAELKLETTSLQNDTNKFIDLLKSQLQANTDVNKYQKNQQVIYNTARALVNNKLKWWQYRRYKFNYVLKLATYGLKNRENMRFARTRIYGVAKDIYMQIGQEMCRKKSIEKAEDIFYLSTNEIRDYVMNQFLDSFEIIKKRKEVYMSYSEIKTPDRVVYTNEKPILKNQSFSSIKTSKNDFRGISVSKGKVTARAKVILQPNYHLNLKGKILITKITDPGWVFLMSQSVGLISEKGSLLSHTAIVGRELGIPVIVGVENASMLIKDDDLLEMDGDSGTVKIIK